MRRRLPMPPMPVLLLLLSLPGAWGCEAPAPARDGTVAEDIAVVRGDTLSGSELAAIFGCGACHAGAPAPDRARALATPLTGLSARWEPAELVSYLVDPVPLREGVMARMPDYHLDSAEAAAVAMHLLRDDGSREVRSALNELARQYRRATAERGAAMVDGLNCAGCHGEAGTEAWLPGPSLASIRERLQPRWLRRYLAEPTAVRPFGYHPGSGSRMPDFDLSAAETDSLVRWVTAGSLDAATAAGPVAEEPDRPARQGPVSAASAEREAATGSSSGRADRLLNDHLACLGCHSLEGAGGRIAPALDGAAARLRPEYLRRIVHAPARTAPGTMMPQPLEDSATLELVIDRLGRWETAGGVEYLSLVEHRPVRPPSSGDRAPETLYAVYCAACHGAAGAGDGFNAAYLPRRPTAHADPVHMSTRPDHTLFDGIHGGGHILGRSHRMPAFGGALTSAEIRGLVGYLRELCACDQPAWAEGL